MINITDQEQKLLRLALNDAAAEGEITNAAVMFIKSLRARGVKADAVQQAPVQQMMPHFSYTVWTSAGGGWTQATQTK